MGTSNTGHGESVSEDEDMSPTLENTLVLLWLQLIHRDLPQLVKRKYAHELRTMTLAPIKPEISVAVDSLLEDLHSTDTKILLASAANYPDNRNKQKLRSDISSGRTV